MSRPPALLALALALLLGLAACGDDDAISSDDTAGTATIPSPSTASSSPASSDATPDSSDSAFAGDLREPDDVLDDAVATTLSTTSFDVESHSTLQIQDQDFQLDITGPVDYDAVVTDTTVHVAQGGSETTARQLSDGTTLWISGEGTQVPAFPDGKTWVSGDASRLGAASSFVPSGVLGAVGVLHGAQDATLVGEGEKDGAPAREYSFTVAYDDAVAAAGADADAFTSAFSLTGDATSADLDVDAWIGADGVLRELLIDVDAGSLPIDGRVSLALTGVDEPVDPPTAPDPADVATGPEADALLDQLLS